MNPIAKEKRNSITGRITIETDERTYYVITDVSLGCFKLYHGNGDWILNTQDMSVIKTHITNS